jgi:Cu2+-exporting ATPase
MLETENLRISGLRCAACVQLIEFRVRQIDGMHEFTINPATHKAKLTWDSARLEFKYILQTIVDLGYAAFPANQTESEFEQKQKRLALWRLFIAGFAMMQVMMYAFPAYLVPVPEVNGDLTPDQDRLLKWASLIITIPVVVFSALPFFVGAWNNLKQKHIGMDVPVAVGIAVTFIASIWATIYGGAVYFDSAIMFVFLLLGARYIEERVQAKTNAALRVLTELHPTTARRLFAYPDRQQSEEIEARFVQKDDVLLIAAGEQIPADGIVIEGRSECDEALMTGESHPVVKTIDSQVIAGSINLHSAIVMRAERVGDLTQLASMLSMMERAATEKPPLVQLADKHASRFLLIILCVAILTGFVWWTIAPERALWIALSVIVVTCPCALSLATPGVMSAAIGRMANHGVLVAKGKAIESLSHVRHFVFDKTGTLTHGKLQLIKTFSYVGNSEEQRELQLDTMHLGLAMAAQSMHPVAKSIADALGFRLAQEQALSSRLRIENIIEVPGLGIEANLNGRIVRLGNLEFVQAMLKSSIVIPDEYKNKTCSLLADQTGVLAIFVLADSIREEAKQALQDLRDLGAQLYLYSGDNQELVKHVAQELGITEYQGGMSPEQKYLKIKHLQMSGESVAMVGDGMNDGPALSLAQVSIAMGQGAPISQSRSDLLLMSNRLLDLSFAVTVTRKSMSLIRQNLSWAIVYNVIAVPAAVIGMLEPWHAALGMSLSSLIVVVNGLRLLNMQPQEQA